MALGKRQLQVLCLVNISQAIMLSLPFTIAVYMVRHFFSGSSEVTIGKMTGALAASYSFAQFASSYPLGLISNKFGRKPVVLLGVVSSAVALITFGNAPTYSVAAAARVIGGLLNGTVGAWKCMVGEMCTPTEQGQAMGWLSLSWGVGNILGPSVGGYLTNVCERWEPTGMCAEEGLLRRRPFLLPCLFGGVVCMVATVVAALFLQETLPAARNSSLRLTSSMDDAEYTKLPDGVEEDGFPPLVSPSGWLPPPPVYRSLDDGICAVAGPERVPTTIPTSTVALSPMSSNSGRNTPLVLNSTASIAKMDNAAAADSGTPVSRLYNDYTPRSQNDYLPCEGMEQSQRDDQADGAGERLAASWYARGGLGVRRPLLEKRGSTVVDVRPGDDAESEQSDSAARQPGEWHKNKQVLLTIAGFVMCSLVWCTLDETVPIYASAAPAKGGLGMKAAMLSLPLATGGMTTIFYAVWGYPRLQKRFGAFLVARGAYCLAVVVCMLLPTTSLLLQRQQPHQAKALLVGTYVLKALAQCSTFTSAIILVNAACHPSQLGAVNGVAQMLASLVRGIGPATSGLLWAMSLEAHSRMHQFVPFTVVALLSILTMALYGKVCRRLRK